MILLRNFLIISFGLFCILAHKFFIFYMPVANIDSHTHMGKAYSYTANHTKSSF